MGQGHEWKVKKMISVRRLIHHFGSSSSKHDDFEAIF